MQSKYKVGLLRLNLMVAALLPALMAPASSTLTEALLLWLAAGWLGISAALVEFSHRRPALVPWQLLPSVLLAALLWSAPERHPLWLWAWAALIMLPQPAWMAALNALLAGLTWSWLARTMPLEHAVVSGLLLAAMMLLGLSRARDLQPLRGLARRRLHLIPGLRLWPRAQLARDLTRERARAQRDGVHCELLLLRTSRQDLWPRAQRLCELTRSFEHCYRLDGRTLGALLLSRDPAQAVQRRRALLDGLGPCDRLRAVPLGRIASLGEECRALQRQPEPMTVVHEVDHG
ncbi:hypothetical protein BDK63_003105 [Halomonas campaniensis]|uniref:GGDEF domain-containing protein n=1 Tax=Halomonas campaniensis TaxID=213554 RepID=A0A7W5PCN5_9GAMM|nr:hypothetical protein [Halomonas campaniensis]MBB3332211.1 hypothetical protein [Halomonas campaniensis]